MASNPTIKALELPLGAAPPVDAAREWLKTCGHREGCQCHRCFWAHGVKASRIAVDFETWRKR